MVRRFSILFLAVTLLVLLSIQLFGQANPTGNLSGTVTDSSGGVVPNASPSM